MENLSREELLMKPGAVRTNIGTAWYLAGKASVATSIRLADAEMKSRYGSRAIPSATAAPSPPSASASWC